MKVWKTLVAMVGLCPVAGMAQEGPQVLAPAGEMSGTQTGGVAAFLGIPYAAPPIVALRWRAPQPLARWTGTRSTRSYGPDCAQAPFPEDAAPIRTKPAEDCLYLNVWKPAGAAAGARLPVMVWIYGGGFVNGGSSPAIYSGDSFARDGVVFVSFNYRLGRFGYFAHPALAAEGGGGNFGLMDQMAALRWVRENISAFGGDPGNVTLFGESAGGMSVHMLMTAPDARGLFQRAIIESGAGRDGALPMQPLAQAERVGEAFYPAKSAAELRALPAARIAGDLNLTRMLTPTFSGPMIDGRTVRRTPFESYVAGDYAKVPVIIGANTADGIPFVTDKSAIFASYGALANQARRAYDPDGTRSGLELGIITWAERNMVEPARAVARLLRRTQPVYLYRFGYVTPAQRQGLGAAHASEIPYVFDTLRNRRDPPFDPADVSTARLLHRYWVNFARSGDPNASGVPAWPKFDRASKRVQSIDGGTAKQQLDPLDERLNLVERASR